MDFELRYTGSDEYLPVSTKTTVILSKCNPQTQLYLKEGQIEPYSEVTIGVRSRLEKGAPLLIRNNSIELFEIIIGDGGEASFKTNLLQDINIFTAESPETPKCYAYESLPLVIDSSKKPTRLEYELKSINGKAATFTIKLLESESNMSVPNQPITVNILDTVLKGTTNKEGICEFTNEFFSFGEYTVQADFAGNDDLAGSTITANLKVAFIKPTITVADNEVHRGSRMKVRLTDPDGVPLAGQKVRILINGVYYDRVTDDEGYVYLRIRLQGTKYQYTISTPGNSNLENVSVTGELTVLDGLSITLRPSRSGIVSQANAPYQREWTFNYLALENNPYYDEYSYMRCNDIMHKSTNYSQPAGLYHTLFNFGELPDYDYIDALELTFEHRVTGVDVGNCVVSVENFYAQGGGNVYMTMESYAKPGTNGWAENKLTFYNEDIRLTRDSLRDHNMRIGFVYGSNSKNDKGKLDFRIKSIKLIYAPKEEE